MRIAAPPSPIAHSPYARAASCALLVAAILVGGPEASPAEENGTITTVPGIVPPLPGPPPFPSPRTDPPVPHDFAISGRASRGADALAVSGDMTLAPGPLVALRPDGQYQFGLQVARLELRVGERTLAPRDLEFRGLRPLIVSLGGPFVPRDGTFSLPLGGDVLEVSDDEQEVTFELLDLALDLEPWSGTPIASGFPGRLDARGVLEARSSTYRVDPDGPCRLDINNNPSGVSGVVATSGVTIEPNRIEIPASAGVLSIAPVLEPLVVPPLVGAPERGGAPLALSARPSQAHPYASAEAAVRNPTPEAGDNGFYVQTLPSSSFAQALTVVGAADLLVEQLEIQGSFTVEEDGSTLIVDSPGSLSIGDGNVDIVGLERLVLRAAESIEVTGTVEVAPGTSLTIEAPGGVVVAGDAAIEIAPLGCPRLVHVETSDPVTVADVEWTARARVEARIDVRPRRSPNRVRPFSRRLLPVALHGSAALDLERVEQESLRFGPRGAAPLGARPSKIMDLDGDGYGDIILRFATPHTGIGLGDTEVCLEGATEDRAFRACDAIETLSRSTERKRRRRRFFWSF